MSIDEVRVEYLAWGIRDNITDLAELWLTSPLRHREFNEHVLEDIKASVLKLNLLLSAIEVSEAA